MSTVELSALRSGREPATKKGSLGFVGGLVCGSALVTVALLVSDHQALAFTADVPLARVTEHSAGVKAWIALNLGHSFWLFALVFMLYVANIAQLNWLLSNNPHSRRVTKLDQLSDVWMHLFVGIGVIWTAVGMRSALQAALGDTPANLINSADAVLRKLVDGGILLALTTTIVGGIGGYLMRLVKTVLLGARLQELFDQQQRSDVQALLVATRRIESRMPLQPSESVPGDSRAPV